MVGIFVGVGSGEEAHRSSCRLSYLQPSTRLETAGHRHAWDGLSDLNTISVGSGLKGLVLLFDEFEDVGVPDLGQQIRDQGHEYGTVTGRPRRCG